MAKVGFETEAKLSDKYCVDIKHYDECFTERIPTENITISGGYGDAYHSVYLSFDELKQLNVAITNHLKKHSQTHQEDSERTHNVALFALDDTGVDGKLPRIGLKGADSQEVKELTEKFAKLTPEQRKELNEFIEKGIDDTIRYFVIVGRHKFEIS